MFRKCISCNLHLNGEKIYSKTNNNNKNQTHMDVEMGKRFNVKQKIPYYLYQRSNLTIEGSSISDGRSLCKKIKRK